MLAMNAALDAAKTQVAPRCNYHVATILDTTTLLHGAIHGTWCSCKHPAPDVSILHCYFGQHLAASEADAATLLLLSPAQWFSARCPAHMSLPVLKSVCHARSELIPAMQQPLLC